jgi:serine phosphatase RsbU (regulator of sigma subunit)
MVAGIGGVVLVPLYAVAPLVASVGARWRACAAVGAVAVVLGAISLTSKGGFGDQDFVRLGAAIAIASLATWTAALRERARERLDLVARYVAARRRAEDERERLLQRAALMAEASEVFDSELDEARTLGSVARLVVRDLADTCVILLGESPSAVRRVASAARDRDRDAALAELLARYPLPGRVLEHPMLEVLREGRGRVVPASDDAAMKARAVDAAHLELMRRLGSHDNVVVPLRARGRTRGVLSAAFARLPAEEAPEMLALFEDLGRRAALALDNARLYEERTRVARTLQQSLLPPALPHVPGIDISSRYLAAGEGPIGGDFYDCFATEAGEWALVIGDVCGKGAEAAAVTALARHTLRAAVLHTRRPREVLAILNEAILRAELDYRFCTAVYAGLTPLEDGRAHVSVGIGGHPLPLVVRADGRVAPLGPPGTLLGIVREPKISEAATQLSPGDALVLYTDGVTEASPRDGALGPDRLAALLVAQAGRDAASVAAAVEAAVLRVQGGRVRDDVAVVVARVGAGRRFPSRPRGVAAVA